MDAIDRKILKLLEKNARMENADIATVLDITDDEAYYLVSNGIQTIRESGFGRENIPAMMAAVVVISLPLIALFLIFRNKIMAGVARGGTKG